MPRHQKGAKVYSLRHTSERLRIRYAENEEYDLEIDEEASYS